MSTVHTSPDDIQNPYYIQSMMSEINSKKNNSEKLEEINKVIKDTTYKIKTYKINDIKDENQKKDLIVKLNGFIDKLNTLKQNIEEIEKNNREIEEIEKNNREIEEIKNNKEIDENKINIAEIQKKNDEIQKKNKEINNDIFILNMDVTKKIKTKPIPSQTHSIFGSIFRNNKIVPFNDKNNNGGKKTKKNKKSKKNKKTIKRKSRRSK